MFVHESFKATGQVGFSERDLRVFGSQVSSGRIILWPGSSFRTPCFETCGVCYEGDDRDYFWQWFVRNVLENHLGTTTVACKFWFPSSAGDFYIREHS